MSEFSKIFRLAVTTMEAILTVMLVLVAFDDNIAFDTTSIILLLFWVIMFIALLFWYMIPAVRAHDNKLAHEAYVARIALEKQEAVKRIVSNGFKSTVSYEGSGRWFAIDENSHRWLAMNFNCPLDAKIYNYSDIRAVEKTENKEMALSGSGVHIGGGVSVNAMNSTSYYTKLGVIVRMKSIDDPAIFINCIDDVNDVGRITSLVETMIERANNTILN